MASRRGGRGTGDGGRAWRRGVARLIVAGVALVGVSAAAGGQEGSATKSPLVQALDLESAGKCREAIPLYRQSIGADDPVGAVLGLERCYSQVGGSEAMLPLVDSLLALKPRDPLLRTVQLRTLIGLRRGTEADRAFNQWMAASPRDPAPFREYARLLLETGRAAAADTVLRGAVSALGRTRDLAAEFAQMQAALGLWVASATSWREASEVMPYMEQAAVFSLSTTPDSLREGVREVFGASPVALRARRILASLETRWRSAREGWLVLSQVPPSDSAVQAWIDFGAEAESNESWLTARDAYVAAAAHRPNDRMLLVKAATAALTGGEGASALALLQPVLASGDSSAAGAVALLEVRALAQLGRAAEIERILAERAGPLGQSGIRQAHQTLAWAWIRSGDLVKARAALIAGGGGTDEDSRVEAWLALYEGDLKTARAGLRRTDETSRDVVTAMALLSRTRAEYAPPVGAAFLVLARGDTAEAARQFAATAETLTDAAPFLLLVSARLWQSSGDTPQAVQLWQRLITDHSDAPEAAEAELDWARLLRRAGDTAGAIAHLEHLILTYTQSALVPQARRELELARGSVPPGRGVDE
ncbi:MAG: hypothetical protein IPF98_12520 [Gemmatimonadetes bacterium]|nr:hypothetical protein [Gemmatimonadota bacterium]